MTSTSLILCSINCYLINMIKYLLVKQNFKQFQEK